MDYGQLEMLRRGSIDLQRYYRSTDRPQDQCRDSDRRKAQDESVHASRHFICEDPKADSAHGGGQIEPSCIDRAVRLLLNGSRGASGALPSNREPVIEERPSEPAYKGKKKGGTKSGKRPIDPPARIKQNRGSLNSDLNGNKRG